jgi:hypothetical protein
VSDQSTASAKRTRAADRLYGDLLLLLAVIALTAPLFVEATLAWELVLVGACGVWWVFLDRTARGLAAAIGWALLTLGLGLHLAFHVGLGILPLDATLCVAFILLGAAELWLGLARYRTRPFARVALIVGAASALAFGVSVPLLWPDLPPWAASVAVSLMFGTLGAALLIGARRSPGQPRQKGSA